MLWPPPYFALIVLGIVAALTWWLSDRMKVAHEPVALMVTRIAFPPNMRLANPDTALAMLDLRDEIVIPYPRATLVIDFPLTHPANIAIHSALPQGFTRAELVRTICEEYMHVYAAEEGTAPEQPVLEDRGHRIERTRTDGAYGIWGHALEDLVLSSARWVKQSNGDVRVELYVQAKPPPAPSLLTQ
ncbi:MAG TPA: hypothetical protein VIV40_20075 [Kofleriaceae bacterium]